MATCTKLLLSFLILLNGLLITQAFAQAPPRSQSLHDLKSLLQDEMVRQHIAGMMLTIVTKDSVVFAGGLGYADLENELSVNENHLFRQASITKLFVSLGILSLVEEGKLRVDTPLKDIAPEIPFKNKWEDTHPITIAQLMEHSTGFEDKTPFEEYNYSQENMSSPDVLLFYKKFMTSKWRPGEKHAYSNINYAILAYVIEKVSGKSFQDFMRTRVFSPMNMPSANVLLRADDTGAYSKGYIWENNQFQLVPHLPQYSPGNGSLHASAKDFAHALQAYLSDWKTPSAQFLSKELLRASETPHTYLSAQAGLQHTYAYGNEGREIQGIAFRGHQGAIGGFVSAFHYNRELGIGFAVSINTYNERFHRYAVEQIVGFLIQHLPTASKPAIYPIDEGATKPYIGYYRLENTNNAFTSHFESLQHSFKLEQHSDELRVNFLLGGGFPWKAADSAQLLFRNDWLHQPSVLFLRDDNNQQVILDGERYFQKISALEAWTPIVLLLFSLFMLGSSLIFGLANVFLFLFKKVGRPYLLLSLSPAIATLGLLLVFWTGIELVGYIKAAAPINKLTFAWTLGKYLFAFFSFLAVLSLAVSWKTLQSKWLRIYVFCVVLGSCYLLGVLVMNSWF